MTPEEFLRERRAVDYGNYYKLTCCKCGKHEAFLYKDDFKNKEKKFFTVRCNRLNHCGFIEEIQKDSLEGAVVEVPELLEAEKKALEKKRVSKEAIAYFNNLFEHVGWLRDYDMDIRGIKNETLKKYHIAYLKDGWMHFAKLHRKWFGDQYFSKYYEDRQILIPIYNKDGNSVDRILMRGYDKPLEMKEIPCVLNKNGEEIFNMPALNSEADIIFVCEGVYDALSVIQAVDNKKVEAVGIPGVAKWKKLLKAVKAMPSAKSKKFVFIFDNDEAGHKNQQLAIKAFKDAGVAVDGCDICVYNDCNEFLQKDAEVFSNSLREFCGIH